MSNNQLCQCQSNVSYKPSISGNNPRSQSDSSHASNSVQESSRPAKLRVTNDHSASPLEQQSEPSQAQESSFHPIVPKTPPHPTYNTLPPTVCHLDAIEPKNILDLFLTTSLLKTMTTNTNSYAAIKRVEKEPSEDLTTSRAWKEVTPDELAWNCGVHGCAQLSCNTGLLGARWPHGDRWGSLPPLGQASKLKVLDSLP